MLLSIYEKEYIMIKEKFKECIALMERDVAEFEKKFCIAGIAQSVDAGAAVRAISADLLCNFWVSLDDFKVKVLA